MKGGHKQYGGIWREATNNMVAYEGRPQTIWWHMKRGHKQYGGIRREATNNMVAYEGRPQTIWWHMKGGHKQYGCIWREATNNMVAYEGRPQTIWWHMKGGHKQPHKFCKNSFFCSFNDLSMRAARRYDITFVKFNVRKISAIILDVTSYVRWINMLVILEVHWKETANANASAAHDSAQTTFWMAFPFRSVQVSGISITYSLNGLTVPFYSPNDHSSTSYRRT
jgi:hypothetical protein